MKKYLTLISIAALILLSITTQAQIETEAHTQSADKEAIAGGNSISDSNTGEVLTKRTTRFNTASLPK